MTFVTDLDNISPWLTFTFRLRPLFRFVVDWFLWFGVWSDCRVDGLVIVCRCCCFWFWCCCWCCCCCCWLVFCCCLNLDRLKNNPRMAFKLPSLISENIKSKQMHYNHSWSIFHEDTDKKLISHDKWVILKLIHLFIFLSTYLTCNTCCHAIPECHLVAKLGTIYSKNVCKNLNILDEIANALYIQVLIQHCNLKYMISHWIQFTC